MTATAYDVWFRETVAAYRRLGFLGSGPFAGLSDAECQAAVEGRFPNWFPDAFEKHSGTADGRLFLEECVLKEDRDRVWTQDAEWVYSDTAFYAEGVKTVSRISRGLFRPRDTEERWWEVSGHPGLVIRLTFETDAGTQRAWISRPSDWANRRFLALLDSLLPEGGPRLRQYGDSLGWFVVVQDDAEAEAMTRRGWEFGPMSEAAGLIADPDAAWPDPPGRDDRWLYVLRGVDRHDRGHDAGAWEDWNLAARLGFPDLYHRVTDLLNGDRGWLPF